MAEFYYTNSSLPSGTAWANYLAYLWKMILIHLQNVCEYRNKYGFESHKAIPLYRVHLTLHCLETKDLRTKMLGGRSHLVC